ncbi:hypothetical protein A3H81_04340 [Candidatus Daviesbacteria bacterium RIFCSPLOWO2_02_FULL_38_18]|nr:MAG: hypothetical protein US80_C0010G0011 [Candidatus Daviesbacteria bacterium GW2011_GWA2_38_17]OGE27808.1 MAG: hypothetical protein A3D02_01830 [Candidatus Daviesbacteria bacterium RIFCSPHIGHO2_02_FULL_39_41]OGE28036.1 MAG: hypothetical protein A2772_02945 [Candidatus Daviesbacteria bacterium RIFCSPHIGHO2_01_FULL_38_8b]OGE44129.1 MAG: hypothetical protein A3E67_05105 [Candidatus Daviesbacteria bacterium RIFCSPHIGHO2_12_FULL_38_25]OGE67490.1 MAG: hypothetical protein A3H81_04340 [Candidatus
MRTPETEIAIKDGFDTAQSVDRLLREKSAYINRPDADRNLPIQESQDTHLERVDRIQERWNLGPGAGGSSRILSYNPVLDRANFERLLEEGATEDQIAAFKRDLIMEMETNLCERFHAARTVVKYVLDDQGNAYGENDFANEPIDIVFQRGALYRIAQGSPEPQRELSAVEGGIKAKKELAREKTPLYSKQIVISPPGLSYRDNFVDIYEASLDPQTGRRIIIMSRFASSLTDDEYRERLTRLQPDYLDGFEGSFDVWCLQNPLKGDQRQAHVIFNEKFRGQQQATEEADMQSILKECSNLIHSYKEAVCGKIFNARELAKAFNAVLNKADAVKEWLDKKGKNFFNTAVSFVKHIGRDFRNAQEETGWFGMQQVREFLAACGLSGGFSLGNIIGGVKNIISKVWGRVKSLFAGKDKYGSLEFECPKCGATNRRPRGQLIPNCQHCGKDVRC